MEHFATDFREFKVSVAERLAKIERLIWENFIGHDIEQPVHTKGQVGLLQNENNRIRMESESLLKLIKFLSNKFQSADSVYSVHQINTREITTTQKILCQFLRDR